jgi:hypothetical protein
MMDQEWARVAASQLASQFKKCVPIVCQALSEALEQRLDRYYS